MKLTFGPDRSGGVRDIFLDDKLIAKGVLSSDAITIVEALAARLENLDEAVRVLREIREKLCAEADTNAEEIMRLQSELSESRTFAEKLKGVAERMSKHGSCAAFDGNFVEQRFVGCDLYHSGDPEEYCLRCEALAALATVEMSKGA